MQTPSAPNPITVALFSLGLGILVLALKAYAAQVTGSVALYSDALETVVNVVTAIVALIAVRLSAKPADAGLPYGYYKAEYFSAVVIGIFIAVAAIVIFYEAWQGLIRPHSFIANPLGIGISVLASVINAGWAFWLLRCGRKAKSPALSADGKHLLTDVVSTIGVLAGLVLAALTGVYQLDPILAGLVGINILWSGWQVLAHSVGGLMDVAVDPAQLSAIEAVIAANAQGAIQAHDIRTRQAGRMLFVDFHLVVAGQMSVKDAHIICDRIEASLREKFDEVTVVIHVEPEAKAKHSGVVVG